MTTEIKTPELAAVATMHWPISESVLGLVGWVLCGCGYHVQGRGKDGARRAWGDHITAVLVASGGFSHYPHLERAARELHRIVGSPLSALDPYGFGQRRQLTTLDAQVAPILDHIDRERGRR